MEDLEEAIILCREALTFLPQDHQDYYTSLGNLALAVWTRFERAGRIEDLEEAIALYHDALTLTLQGHPFSRFPHLFPVHSVPSTIQQ